MRTSDALPQAPGRLRGQDPEPLIHVRAGTRPVYSNLWRRGASGGAMPGNPTHQGWRQADAGNTMHCSAIDPGLCRSDTAPGSGGTDLMGERGLVAIVDDDAGVRSAISMLVRALGWEPRTYDSAETFLRRREEDTDCLVLDLGMPGMSGLDLQRELAARGVAIPVVIVTARGDQAMARAAMDAGALAVLGKPFRDDELRYWIERAFEACP